MAQSFRDREKKIEKKLEMVYSFFKIKLVPFHCDCKYRLEAKEILSPTGYLNYIRTMQSGTKT